MYHSVKDQDKKVLRWGGFAGIIGGGLSIVSMVVAEGIIPAAPAETIALIERFSAIRNLRVVENLSYLFGILCGIILCVSLFWALRKINLASALFGSVLGVIGMTSMAVFSTPHVSHNTIANLYQSVELTKEAQETFSLMWEATWGITEAPLYVGFLVGMVGFTFLGIAMLRSKDFSQALSYATILIGAAGTLAAIYQMVDPASVIGAVSFFAFVVFDFMLGFKVLSLSNAKNGA